MTNAKITLPAKYIISDPVKPFDEIGITSVTISHNKLSVDTSGQTANYGPWSREIPTAYDNGQYKADISLDDNSYYAMRVTARNENGSKQSRIFFINSADEKTYYRMDFNIRENSDTTGEREKPIPGANFVLTPPPSTEYPKWIEGLKDSLGNPTYVENPTEGAQLYAYVTQKITGGTIEIQSDAHGQVGIGYLEPGIYDIEISATGYLSRTGIKREISNANLTGNWDLTKV